jgi:DNA-binding IclR family transcriptional regulator
MMLMPLVKSAQRVTALLEYVAHNPPGLSYSELLVSSDLPKSSLHALLTTLVHDELLRYDAVSKRYTLGSRLFAMASAYTQQFQIAPAAWPYMTTIRDALNETVQLAVLDGSMVVYLAKVEARRPLQLASSVGSRLPAYATGIGQALLATLDDSALKNHLPATFTAYTKTTLTSRESLQQKLREARRIGYATDLGEYSVDTRCVAVPVLGSALAAVGALSISVSASRFDEPLKNLIVPVLQHHAYALAHTLGANNPEHWRRLASPSSVTTMTSLD